LFAALAGAAQFGDRRSDDFRREGLMAACAWLDKTSPSTKVASTRQGAVKRVSSWWPKTLARPLLAWTICLWSLLLPLPAMAAPSAEIAKQCLRAAYMLYPYQRPGAASMRGDRLFFFNECVAKHQAETRPTAADEGRLHAD